MTFVLVIGLTKMKVLVYLIMLLLLVKFKNVFMYN